MSPDPPSKILEALLTRAGKSTAKFHFVFTK